MIRFALQQKTPDNKKKDNKKLQSPKTPQTPRIPLTVADMKVKMMASVQKVCIPLLCYCCCYRCGWFHSQEGTSHWTAFTDVCVCVCVLSGEPVWLQALVPVVVVSSNSRIENSPQIMAAIIYCFFISLFIFLICGNNAHHLCFNSKTAYSTFLHLKGAPAVMGLSFITACKVLIYEFSKIYPDWTIIKKQNGLWVPMSSTPDERGFFLQNQIKMVLRSCREEEIGFPFNLFECEFWHFQ